MWYWPNGALNAPGGLSATNGKRRDCRVDALSSPARCVIRGACDRNPTGRGQPGNARKDWHAGARAFAMGLQFGRELLIPLARRALDGLVIRVRHTR